MAKADLVVKLEYQPSLLADLLKRLEQAERAIAALADKSNVDQQ
jgi:hypothetical protein